MATQGRFFERVPATVPEGVELSSLITERNQEEWTASQERFYTEVLPADGRDLYETAFNDIVKKIHNRCNIACTYCYVYELGDVGFADQMAGAMPVGVIEQTADRVQEFYHDHFWAVQDTPEPPGISLTLHGGEPLLTRRTDRDYLRRLVSIYRRRLGDAVEFNAQTNGILLDEELLDEMLELDIHLGVSLDGNREQNRDRLYRSGRESYDEAVRGIRLLASDKYRSIFGGLLCTINIKNDPVETYKALRDLDPTSIDFLWPMHEQPAKGQYKNVGTWLVAAYNAYAQDFRDGTGPGFFVRNFAVMAQHIAGETELARHLAKGPLGVEYFPAVELPRNVVVDPDGKWMNADGMKSNFNGADNLGLNVFDHSLREVWLHPAVRHRQLGRVGLSSQCQQCQFVDVCGGQAYASRFRAPVDRSVLKPGAFDPTWYTNPSKHCNDVQTIVTHIANQF